MLWDALVKGSGRGTVSFDTSAVAEAVRKTVQNSPHVVCEGLADSKRRALGTIVSQDGYVLTKAGELYSNLRAGWPTAAYCQLSS